VMKTTGRILVMVAVLNFFYCHPAIAEDPVKIRLAVEFVDHAACAHIAASKGWYQEAGLDVQAFDSYATGMALSAALSRGGIDAAYMCLFPAINAYANGGVPLKIVAGTHHYGYGLIVNPEKIKNIRDLEAPGIRLGCTSEGSPPAALLHMLVEKFRLNPTVITRTRRMAPPKLLLSLQSGRIDAAFMPEQFPTMGESSGFRELISAADLWPGMQGSVLVVTRGFLEAHPDTVRKLVAITARGIRYINDHPVEAAQIVANELDVAGKEILPVNLTGSLGQLSVTREIIQRSLTNKLENTQAVNQEAVQEAIDYAARIRNIKHSFSAEEILDLRYLHE
jgi:NitT/TauT family transport system substrate-binding protein